MAQIVLDRNENQYGPAPACYKVLREANLEQLSLYSRDYALGRKSELSYRLSQEIGIPEERLLLSYGSEDMLKQIVHCYLKAGETMLLPHQSWWYYKSIAKEVGGKQVEYTLHERGDRFEYDIEEIIRLYNEHHPQLILIASPNNPTGNSILRADLVTLIDHCSASIIVLDEAYFGFTSESNEHLKGFLDVHARLVVLRTFSKYFALAGLRIGYSYIGEDLKHLVAYSARYLGYNQLTEKIALSALDSKEYYRGITRQMVEDKESYMRELRALEGFTPFASDANFMLVRYPVRHKLLLQSELKRRNVILKFLDDPGLQDCIRITIGTQEQNAYVLASVKEIAQQHLYTTV
jgi:histidinol-phosphate aminotransferase